MSGDTSPLSSQFEPVDLDRWRERVERDLKGASFEKRLMSRTYEGIGIHPIYTPDDWNAAGDPSGFPGCAPYTRGSRPLGRSDSRWDLRARIGHPEPEQAAAVLASERKRDARSLWLEPASHVRLGRDADAPNARLDDGVRLDHADGLAALLKGVDFERTSVWIDAGASGLPVAALLLEVARVRGIQPSGLRGGIGFDPLATLAAEGELPGSLEGAWEQLADLTRFAAKEAPGLRTALISTTPYHDAGAHAVQEVGYALASGIEAVRALLDRGVRIEDASSRIAFRFSVGPDFFMEIAKLRAMRLGWAKVVAACGGDEDAQRAVLHAQTSWRAMTQRDPWVNLLRATTESLAAAVGGADGITVVPFDALLGHPDAFARRLAANTQHILNEESHVGHVADPAGGSWYVETLTETLAARAWEQMQSIEAQGGMARALLDGTVGAELERAASARKQAVDTRRAPITGVSEFPNVHEAPVERARSDEAALQKAAARELSAHRKTHPVAAAVAPLEQALAERRPYTPAALEAAGSGATLGAMASALATGQEPTCGRPLERRRDAAPLEALRDAADAHRARHGSRPTAFLVNLGAIPEHKARAGFAANLLQAGGFEPLENDGFPDPDSATRAYAESKAPIAVICSSDARYAEMVERVAPKLREAGAKSVVLAGKPGEREAAWRSAGVDRFIFMGCDAYQTLSELQQDAGVSR